MCFLRYIFATSSGCLAPLETRVLSVSCVEGGECRWAAAGVSSHHSLEPLPVSALLLIPPLPATIPLQDPVARGPKSVAGLSCPRSEEQPQYSGKAQTTLKTLIKRSRHLPKMVLQHHSQQYTINNIPSRADSSGLQFWHGTEFGHC